MHPCARTFVLNIFVASLALLSAARAAPTREWPSRLYFIDVEGVRRR